MATTTIPWAGQLPYTSDQNKATPFGPAAANNNAFMTNQSILPFLQNLPGYANAVGQRSENTQQMLEGRLPQDVVNQLATRAAERGISSPNSPNSNSAYLAALGLNSLQMMGQGSQQLSQSIQDTPVPELFNPASLWAPEYTAKSELGQLKSGQALQALKDSNAKASAAWNANRNGTTYSNYLGLGGSFAPGGF